MGPAKMQHCFNCGAELGVYEKYYGDLDTCGERECEQAAREAWQGAEEDRAERAREDRYERY